MLAVASTCAVPMLPTLALPLALTVPAILAPVPVIVNIVLPTAVMVTFPLLVAMLTLLFPFACGPIKLPAVKLPETLRLVNVPVLVILGCALVVNVPVK